MTYIRPQVDVQTEKGFWYRKKSGDKRKQDSDGTCPLYKAPNRCRTAKTNST